MEVYQIPNRKFIFSKEFCIQQSDIQVLVKCDSQKTFIFFNRLGVITPVFTHLICSLGASSIIVLITDQRKQQMSIKSLFSFVCLPWK